MLPVILVVTGWLPVSPVFLDIVWPALSPFVLVTEWPPVSTNCPSYIVWPSEYPFFLVIQCGQLCLQVSYLL